MKNIYLRAAILATMLGGALVTSSFGQQYPPPPPPPYPQGQQQQYPPQDQNYPQQQYPTGNYSQPPALSPQQLDQVVGSVALYPDGLLAHVLTASTFPEQIPAAAGWANQHAYLRGPALADAIRRDSLPWDVSVLALLPFPQVLGQLAQNMQWTQQLGDAVLVQRGEVMEAVQRLRGRANDYGYFRDPQFAQYERVEVRGPGFIEIEPLAADYYVPYYDTRIFYAPPRPGFYGVFRFGAPVSVGVAFGAWGWGGAGFGWREHTILIDRNPWNRGWQNRSVYNHPYVQPYRREGDFREHHDYQPQRQWEHREEHRDGNREREREHR